jgi:hypothetical protein
MYAPVYSIMRRNGIVSGEEAEISGSFFWANRCWRSQSIARWRKMAMHKAKQLHAGFFETNGTQLYYEMMGEGHPLVLLHG